MYVCKHACMMYVCMYVDIHMCMYIYIHVCIYTYTYICIHTYICIYTYICIHIGPLVTRAYADVAATAAAAADRIAIEFARDAAHAYLCLV